MGNGPVFGAHVVFGSQSPPPDANLIRDLGIQTTTLWLYPGSGSAFNVSQAVQTVDEIKRQTGGLDVRVHLMPLSQAEARSLGNMFRLPDNMGAYLASVRQLAQALKGKVQHYSMGNEFSGLSWLGTVEEYGQLLAQSRQAIKSVDPAAVILDSGMAGLTLAMTIPNDLYRQGKTQEAIDFLNKLIEHHVGGFRQYLPIANEAQLVAFLNRPEVAKTIQMSDARFTSYCGYYDALQLHDYEGWETLEEVFDWVQGKMNSAGCRKPIEVWELGYGWDDAATYNVDLHAKGVAKSLIIAVAKGAQTIIYFPLTDRGNFARALLTRSYGVLPPAIAYKVAVQKLSGVMRAEKLDLNEGLWVYQFIKGGQEIYALWSDATRTVSLPINADTVKITRINGETLSGAPRSLIVDDSPIFVEPAL